MRIFITNGGEYQFRILSVSGKREAIPETDIGEKMVKQKKNEWKLRRKSEECEHLREEWKKINWI